MNCINIYSSYTDPLQSGSVGGPQPVDGGPLDGGGLVNVRRSASGVFRLAKTIRNPEISLNKQIDIKIQIPQRLRLRHQPFEQRTALLN